MWNVLHSSATVHIGDALQAASWTEFGKKRFYSNKSTSTYFKIIEHEFLLSKIRAFLSSNII